MYKWYSRVEVEWMRAKERISKWRKKALDVFETKKEVASETWAKISEHLGFWRWIAILLLGSPIFAFTIYIVLDQLVSGNYHLGVIWAPSEDARYILSALSQAQAAIFGIFFTKISAGCPRLQSGEECVTTPASPWHRKVHLHR
jgi:hypothetical protein